MTRRASEILVAFAFAAALAAVAGCAARKAAPAPGMPIEQRPTPTQPLPDQTPPPAPTDGSAPPDTTAVPPPRPMAPSAEESMRTVVARDTALVSATLRRCAQQSLLPEQETTWEAAMKLLADTREALLRGDVSLARSLARNAKQLASSLDCQD